MNQIFGKTSMTSLKEPPFPFRMVPAFRIDIRPFSGGGIPRSV